MTILIKMISYRQNDKKNKNKNFYLKYSNKKCFKKKTDFIHN